ncbi:unnamed protein product, partial [Ectocarpus fasciculatus]
MASGPFQGLGAVKSMSKTTMAVVLLMILALGSAQSCVRIVDSPEDASPYPDESSLTFAMEGVTNFTNNNVDIAIVVDGSGSIEPDDWIEEQNFAKDAVAAFAS